MNPADSSTGDGDVSKQLLQTAASLTRVIKSGELEFTRQETNILQEFVKLERAAAETLVNDINKHLNSDLGWHIQLYKWEDIPRESIFWSLNNT